MARYTTSLKKEEVLSEVIRHFEDALHESEKAPSDDRKSGAYTALWDLLRDLNIYDSED